MTTQTPMVDQRELVQKAERFIPGGCLGMMALPADLRMVMVRGQGSKVYDAAGKEYLDHMLGSRPLLLGHCRPEVVEAVQREAALGSTYFTLNEPAIRLAETIVDAAPCGDAIRFQTTGSEATFAAVRLARAFTGRNKVLKFEGGWHGGHDLGQLSGAPAEPPPFPEATPDCDGIAHSARMPLAKPPTPAVTARFPARLASVPAFLYLLGCHPRGRGGRTGGIPLQKQGRQRISLGVRTGNHPREGEHWKNGHGHAEINYIRWSGAIGLRLGLALRHHAERDVSRLPSHGA